MNKRPFLKPLWDFRPVVASALLRGACSTRHNGAPRASCLRAGTHRQAHLPHSSQSQNMGLCVGGRQNGSRGFTLIETLVTLMILSVGLVLVLQAFQTSLRALGEARDTLWSTFVLKDAAGKASLAGKSSTSMMSASAGLWDTGHGVWKWQMTPGFAGSPRNVQTRDIETVVLHEMKILAWREDSARVEEIGLWATAIERANRERR